MSNRWVRPSACSFQSASRHEVHRFLAGPTLWRTPSGLALSGFARPSPATSAASDVPLALNDSTAPHDKRQLLSGRGADQRPGDA
jgi:hypothetical protein